ncbi:MAG: S46 family peptidase [Lewinellaceae bacterium]|nr:S46 family peptidase [Lewinellaceae bacterium]
MFRILFLPILLLGLVPLVPAQNTIYEPLDLDKVHYAPEDFGTMWTFDAVPTDRFAKLYEFEPSTEWLDDVRLSALEFSTGCSASFVSEDGLIMTNHHCIRGLLPGIQQEGENLQRDGFYAETLENERVFPRIFVDQLLSIRDVTDDIQSAMAKGKNDEEQLALRDERIAALTREGEQDGLKCRVITLYNGGKYVLHTYRRYGDVRLVMAPDVQITATGWDWDNFTYPRYELDFAFLRAYDAEGKPVKSPHFFQWSEKGAEDNEPVFVVGRPGNTDRLLSLSELNYYRDAWVPAILTLLNEKYQAQFEHYQAHPEREAQLLADLLSVANSRKVFAGYQLALHDDYLMTKKQDFERELKKRMNENEALLATYGDLWGKIEAASDVLTKNFEALFAHSITSFSSPDRLLFARKMVDFARLSQLPEQEQDKALLNKLKGELVLNIGDEELEQLRIRTHANFLAKVLGTDSPASKTAYNGLTGEEAVQYVLDNSRLADPEAVLEMLADPQLILNSKDPYLRFAQMAADRQAAIGPGFEAAEGTLEVQNQRLAKLIFAAFGTAMPPDATSSLRISDGRIKGYEYNGTLAPAKTTYYGLWDRYYSFNKTYPWGLHERWRTPAPGLDLSLPICFVSDNDIVGGNSGSAVINRNAEVVGLVHDGNLESLAGNYGFIPEVNRAIATDAWGLIEALKWVYKTDRLVKELEGGKM